MTDEKHHLKNETLLAVTRVKHLSISLQTAIEALDAVTAEIASSEPEKTPRVFKCEGPHCPNPQKEIGRCVPEDISSAEALKVIVRWLMDCLEIVKRLPEELPIPEKMSGEADAAEDGK